MNRVKVFYNQYHAGFLTKGVGGYIYEYTAEYLSDDTLPAISLTLPKRSEPFVSKELFPFFFGLLAEGSIKDIQCKSLRIDEEDHFTRLVKTAYSETIGAVTVREAV